MYLQEEDRRKTGLSSFAIRIVGFIVLAVTVVNKLHIHSGLMWIDYFTWLCYPIFAFLLAEGFEQTTSKFRYFIRLVIFALLSEVPYDLLTSGKVFDMSQQNGLFTLCFAFLAMCAIHFVYNKTYNLIITMASIYVYGWGAYYVTKLLNCESYSFGVMIVIFFYISNHVSYPKLLQLAFLGMMTFYLTSNAYISFIIGYMQYTIPYRALAVPAFILTWFYKGKRGPNSIGLQICMYAFYPVLLLAVWLVGKYLI